MCLVQQDEDQEDPDERHHADSDVEMDDVKPLDDSGRYLFLFSSVIVQVIRAVRIIWHGLMYILLSFRRSSIQNVRVKRESAETDAADQVFFY